MAYKALKELQYCYPHIKFYIVLAYYPSIAIEDSIYPEGLETVPKRFCIDKRNRWMLKRADYVVVYIQRNVGGAAKYWDVAVKSGKNVINLCK